MYCDAIFTTIEGVEIAGALRVAKQGRYEPLLRDKLFVDIYDSLRHRKTALGDATALTATILGKLQPQSENARLDRGTIVNASISVLERFDKAAATHYRAFHPPKE